MLTAFVTRPPSSAAATCSATITPARSCASSVEAARCGVTTTLSSSSSGPEYGSCREDVERRPRDLARSGAPRQRLLVDQLAAGGVDDRARRRACFASASRPRKPRVSSVSGRCSVRKSAAASTSSGGLERARRRARGSAPSTTNGSYATTRIPRPSARRATCWPMRPKPSTPSVLSGELDPAPARALPAALLERRVRLRDVAGQREQEADRVLGGGDDGRLGRVRDDDPAARRGVDVDVVDADAGPADHLQPLARARSGRRSASSPSGSRSRRSRRSSRRGRESPSTSTSKRSRRSSTPASAIGSRTRTRLGVTRACARRPRARA